MYRSNISLHKLLPDLSDVDIYSYCFSTLTFSLQVLTSTIYSAIFQNPLSYSSKFVYPREDPENTTKYVHSN